MNTLATASEPIRSGMFHGYILENPWPLGLILVVAGCIIGAWALREGRSARLPLAAALLVIGGAVVAIGTAVTTSGEHAQQIAEDLIAAVEGNDLTGADRLLADSMTYGATDLSNLPVGGKDAIMRGLADFAVRVTIDENRITASDIASVNGDEGHVRLSLWTEASGGAGQVPLVGRSSWILVVKRDPDGIWRVHRLIWVELNGQRPPIHRI